MNYIKTCLDVFLLEEIFIINKGDNYINKMDKTKYIE